MLCFCSFHSNRRLVHYLGDEIHIAVIQCISQQFHHHDGSNLKTGGYILAYGFRGLKFIDFGCIDSGSEHHSTWKHVAEVTNFIVDRKQRKVGSLEEARDQIHSSKAYSQ